MSTDRRIFITGATGGLGRRLVVDRLARGDSVVVLSRRPDEARRLFAAVANPRIEVVEGDPGVPGRWQRLVGACDAVVHLAGEPIAARRWNAGVRETIRRSRVEGTYQVAFSARTASKPPPVFVSASGIGILPRGHDGPLDETAPPGRDFLAGVALAWEREAMRARSEATRVVVLRIPIVLDAASGFLREMAPWWRRGFDPTPWSGRDRVPWIHWRDFLRVVDRALVDDRLAGPVHAVAPEAPEAAAWRRAIAAAVGRGAWRIPVIASRIAAGAVIDAMRGSCEAKPSRLESIGFVWQHSELFEAVSDELRPSDESTGSAIARKTPGSVEIAAPTPRSPSDAEAPRPAPSPPEARPAAPVDVADPPRAAPRPAAEAPSGSPPSRSTPRRTSSSTPVEAVARADDAPSRSPASPAVRTTVAAAVVCSTAAIEPNDARQVERLASLIASWRALGLETVIAAQGGLASIDPLLAALGFGGPLILDLGASLRSGAERRLLRSTPLPPAIVVALLERLAGSPGIRASLHGAEGPIEPRRLRGSTPVRLDLAGDQPAIDGAIAAISEPWWREGAIAVFRTTPELASVVAGGVDKAVGLQRILRGLGLPPSRAFVIAGGEEDLGLLGLCRGMLLGTATARLAAAASITVPRGAWSDVDAAVRHAFAAILSESAPSVHSHASDPAS